MRQLKARHFTTTPEGMRDLRLASAWIAALLLVSSAANIIAIWIGAGQ